MSCDGAALQPTFYGHVANTHDALILFEACLQGCLSCVPRRPHDGERSSLIRSGSVFIYEENASGIKRWTDGVSWSPSRILGSFLIYRELREPFPTGEKKRVMKKQQRQPCRPKELDPYSQPGGSNCADGQCGPLGCGGRATSKVELSLFGSLIDSYKFKREGLVKKTMSVTVHGAALHLVSYYMVEDVVNNQLCRPSETENLRSIGPREEILSKQNFRSPNEVDQVDRGQRYCYEVGHSTSKTAISSRYLLQGSQPTALQPNRKPYGIEANPVLGYGFQYPATTSHMLNHRSEYSHDHQSGYSRGCDSLHEPTMLIPGPTLSTAAITPPTMSDRIQAQFEICLPINSQRSYSEDLASRSLDWYPYARQQYYPDGAMQPITQSPYPQVSQI